MSDHSDEELPAPRVHRIQNGPSATSVSELSEGLSRWMDASKPFLYVELASLVLMFAVVFDWKNSVWYKYALSVSLVSLLLCLVLQTLEFLIPGVLELVLIDKREDGSGGHTVQKICASVLLLWWVIGTAIITFHGPFVETSNGWIGAWGGLIATARWSIGLKDSWYKDRPEGLKQMINIAACSLILLFASIPPIIHKWENYGGAGLSVAGSVITLITCAYLALMYSDFPRNLMKITVLLLLVLWVCVAGVCTFHGPFLVTTNGYFAAWLGCLSALNLMIVEMKDGSPEQSQVRGRA